MCILIMRKYRLKADSFDGEIMVFFGDIDEKQLVVAKVQKCLCTGKRWPHSTRRLNGFAGTNREKGLVKQEWQQKSNQGKKVRRA